MKKKILLGVLLVVLLIIVAVEAVMIVNIFEASRTLDSLPVVQKIN